MLTENDLTTLKNRGITLEQLNDQLERFRTGFPYLRLEGSATVGHGITAVNDSLTAEAVARWDKYLADGGSVCKFVPASGAASRMFNAPSRLHPRLRHRLLRHAIRRPSKNHPPFELCIKQSYAYVPDSKYFL